MSYARRIDGNQKAIVKRLRNLPAKDVDVFISSAVGKDFPDLVVGYSGINYLIELKDAGNSLEPGQRKFHIYWKGQSSVCYNFWDVLFVIGYEKITSLFKCENEEAVQLVLASNKAIKRHLLDACGRIEKTVVDFDLSLDVINQDSGDYDTQLLKLTVKYGDQVVTNKKLENFLLICAVTPFIKINFELKKNAD